MANLLRPHDRRIHRNGRILLVVDQPTSIGALPVAVARACGHQVAYRPGLVMAGRQMVEQLASNPGAHRPGGPPATKAA